MGQGKCAPIRQVLGKSKMILGLLEGISMMLKGELAVFKMKPEFHYGEDDCPVSVSDSFSKDAQLNFEIEMIEFSKNKARTTVGYLYFCTLNSHYTDLTLM
ncbi:putative peptidylprolyl isomerase [Helianthus annuus]|uniref:peptidylprolyl isomerase n=1 Tax=Helianthus annuus TaxID=4232 RepID=A0A9K3DV77_HELAN|nr:putative peptidylprolyl isomerase [Helianthus annuus]KAJ0438856.1 putative peptidylprolyl isomerase [Helianthus annuus]KAJ0443775.1 putative peptidylprolyl isomerase [Helianthus annuus]KAJ0461208.1 putative peptidylprolyl isomerase [Helianthus annuus]KAJ0641626.1 putative peptidylprolyl isomerase [Helianthus annuus]